MKNYSSILTTLLTFLLLACSADEAMKEKPTPDDPGGNGDPVPPIINKALADASDDDPVKNWLDGTTEGTVISKVAYGSVKDGAFTEASADDLAKTTQKFLQIGEGDDAKIYHNINADAKLLLENGAANFLYLAADEQWVPKLTENLAEAAKDLTTDVTYEGIVNAKWSNFGSDPNLRYYAATSAGAPAKYATVYLIPSELQQGTVKVVVLKDGSKATITIDDIGNSADSEDFGWEYDGNPITSDTAKNALLASTPGPGATQVKSSKVWKPQTAPVIEIASTGAISFEGSVYASDGTGNIVDFIGKSEVGGKLNIDYSISETATMTTNNLYSGDWLPNPAAAVEADFYSPIGGNPYRGELDLAFVAYKNAAE